MYTTQVKKYNAEENRGLNLRTESVIGFMVTWRKSLRFYNLSTS